MMQNVTTNLANRTGLTYQDELLIINIKVIVFGWIILFVGVIGIVLNSFTIVVLMHPKMRAFSTNAYLTALSGANIICLLSYIVLYALRYLVSAENFKQAIRMKSMGPSNAFMTITMHPYESFINFSIRFISPLFTTFQLYAIYLTCAVTIDRWIYLTWPLKADKICTMRNTLIAITGIFLFCVFYNSPKWFEVSCKLNTNPATNQTYYQAYATEFSRSYFILIINRYGYLIFIYGIPFLTLLIVNIGIIIKLIETKKRKSHLLGKPTSKYSTQTSTNSKEAAKPTQPASSELPTPTIAGNYGNMENNNGADANANKKSRRNENTFRPSLSASIASTLKLDPKITLMILAVVLAFFCCQFPYLIIHMLHSSHAGEKWYLITKTFCDFLASLNCCINFLIYCLFGRNFRQIAKTILCNPSLSPYNQQLLQKQQNARNASRAGGASSVYEKSKTQIYREKKSRVDHQSSGNADSYSQVFKNTIELNETPRPTRLVDESADATKSLLENSAAENP